VTKLRCGYPTPGVLLADYRHFLELAARRRWEENGIDLWRDAGRWRALGAERDRLLRVLAGFCVGEAAVAGELEPFALAAGGRERAACFRAQAADEERHARFFDRAAAEVAGVPGPSPEQRREAMRPLAGEGLCTLFEVALPAVAGRLGAGGGRLAEAVGLYHMLLEAMVLSAGQFAMLELLRGLDLPGLRRGLELTIGDERWHIGFGVRVLQDLDPGEDAVEHLLGDGATAVAAWDGLVDAELSERMLLLQRRRLRAAGLLHR
jgi:ribonucleoside-diphosphate reductase beta chain